MSTKPEANEIILINSHDGASSYQMLAGCFRLWPAGHSLKSTVRYLGIEVDDALEISEQTEI